MVVEREHVLSFEDFYALAERPLRVALAARYGVEAGREATSEALAYAWQHWIRVRSMSNPIGYLYRVGQTAARRYRRQRRIDSSRFAVDVGESVHPWIEPGLDLALSKLTLRQRQAVLLVHGCGLRRGEVATLLHVSENTIKTHEARGMASLRAQLGANGEGPY